MLETMIALIVSVALFSLLRTDYVQILIGSILQYSRFRVIRNVGLALEFERTTDAIDGVDEQGKVRFMPVTWPGIYYLMFCLGVSILMYWLIITRP